VYLLSLSIFVERKKMTSVNETSYEPCALAAISVTLSSASYKASPTAQT